MHLLASTIDSLRFKINSKERTIHSLDLMINSIMLSSMIKVAHLMANHHKVQSHQPSLHSTISSLLQPSLPQLQHHRRFLDSMTCSQTKTLITGSLLQPSLHQPQHHKRFLDSMTGFQTKTLIIDLAYHHTIADIFQIISVIMNLALDLKHSSMEILDQTKITEQSEVMLDPH
jgi:hypothetical protein